GANQIISLAYWGIRLGGDRIRQVSLVGDTVTIGGISYVIASRTALRETLREFLTPPNTTAETGTTRKVSAGAQASPGVQWNSGAEASGGGQVSGLPTSSGTTTTSLADLRGVEVEVLNANGREGEGAAAAKWLTSLGATVVNVGNADRLQKETAVRYPSGKYQEARLVQEVTKAATLSRTSAVDRVTLVLGEDFKLPREFALPTSINTIPNSSEWKALAKMVPFALQAPAYLPEGYVYADRMPPTGGTYDIEVDGGTKPALKMVYRLIQNGKKTDQYMGIMETTWLDAPAAAKGEEVKYNGTTFTIVGSSNKVERVWWKKDGVLYWVSNTLSYLLSRDELLAVAKSMISVPKP
ncbi:MAG: LytR C-terminal domain-containing protein, partial [Thermoleophilia bacterium]|nr:LytR C-terminal domain-containing protein [Thermoleophilia bacterium]